LVTQDGSSFTIELDGMNAKWAQPPRLKMLGELFKALPNGSFLEMVTAEEEDEEEQSLAGLHRYQGEVTNGIWHLAESFPQLDKQTLEDALNTARQVDCKEGISFRSEDELEAVQEKYLENDFLLRENPPVRKGLVLVSEKEPMYTALVGSWLLRERYPETWVYLDLNDELENWDAMMGQIEEAFAAPTQGEVILEGVAATFVSADMNELPQVDVAEVSDHDEQMMELGFVHIGDLVCSKFSDVVLRGYVHASEPAYGVMLRNTFGSGGSDIYTVLGDGWSLTTSTLHQSADLTRKKLVQVVDDLPAGWELHRKTLKELAPKYGKPAQIERTLAGFAGALDEFLQRTT
jgi:hypothetical protein